MKNKYALTIGWLYPELMSTYGDRGNITVLQKRCEWRGIAVEIKKIDEHTSDEKIRSIDLLFGGGAQDREQEIVIEHLKKKQKAIKTLIEQNIPALFVCGAPQLMGNYYEPAEGQKIEGLSIFDIYTKHPGIKSERLIGNLAAEIIVENLKTTPYTLDPNPLLVGFENHGGRTYLGPTAKPFAKVLKGHGNNGEDGTEGVVYKNAIGCYLHGPLLPKNPGIADWLITKALEVKYKKQIKLESLDDSVEENAKSAIARRLGVAL
jgi:CobQ-like glutamine amidotransferase family enzyme